MLKKFIVILFLISTSLFAQEKEMIFMHGYLGGDDLQPTHEKLDELRQTQGGTLVIQINSSSGNLQDVLNLVQHLYELRIRNDKFIIVYIQGKAVGPAAIIPFLADEIITTPLVAWGDIPYGTRDEMSTSLLRTTVKGIIKKNNVRTPVLEQVADAMIDPHYQLIYNRQKIEGNKGFLEQSDARSRGFDPLILNLKGMESLSLVNSVMTDDEFSKKFLDKEETLPTLFRISDVTSSDELHEMFKQHISYSETEENLIGYLYLGNDRPIDQASYIYIKFALEDYKKKGVRFVILHLNTPGGEVLSSMKIADLLQRYDVRDHIPVIAFIDDWAISAGAMLAYSCRFIAVIPSSIMGAAEPVLLGQEGRMESASEKVNSALRAEFASLAIFYNKNPLIAEAMVDKDMILVIRNHKIVQLRNENDVITSGHNPDILITDQGKLLTLRAEQLINLGVADFEVPLSGSLNVSEKEQRAGTWPAKKTLIFEEPYLSKIPNAFIISHKDWRIDFFTVLSHPIVASLLLMGLIVGLYIEINTPGFGLPGSIALACLSLILLSSFASHAINWIEIIILIAGFILLALELFVIPGFGITGILGILLTIIGLLALMLPGISKLNIFDLDTFRLVGMTFIERLAWLCGALVFSIIVIVLLAKFISHRFFRFSNLILKGEQEAKEGYISGIPREQMPEEGEIGETVTPLRPSGKVHIGDNLFDGITQGGYLDTNVPVEVVRVEGSKIVVRPLEEEIK